MNTEDNEVAITITKSDIPKAMSELLSEDGPVSEIVHSQPELMLLFVMFSHELWDTLEKNARMNSVANTILDMINKEDK